MLQLSLPNPLKPDDEDVVGAATTGDAPTTSEWWTDLLPTKVPLILEVWRYIKLTPSEAMLWFCFQLDAFSTGKTLYPPDILLAYSSH